MTARLWQLWPPVRRVEREAARARVLAEVARIFYAAGREDALAGVGGAS